jgi:hypothetical protein
MNTFKKKSLYAALAGVGALGVTGAAQAVNVNPDGLGQALIYPYYTVRAAANGDAYNTLLSVVNSTASAKGVKVRFLEGKNSREVLDFNLYLSARDVWTAAVVPTADGAAVVTYDVSCTVPTLTPGTQYGFVNYAYASDLGGGSLDRTREGYVEIIEMGDLTGAAATAATHVNGVPPCTGLSNDALVSGNIVLGGGGLFGGLTLINVNKGADTGVDAVALEAWRQAPNGPVFAPPSATTPDLSQAAPTSATVYNAGTATTYSFTTGIDAVSATMMHNTLMNEIILDTGTASGTDWVITFPTKRFYVSGLTAQPPFQRPFVSSGACDDIAVSLWDREERTGSSPVNFSPPLGPNILALCWEANVLTWNNSNVLASSNSRNINPSDQVSGYQNGWALINFTANAAGPVTSHRLVSTAPVATFSGLPVVGFNVSTFNNNTLGGTSKVDSRYGQSFIHKYTRQIN